MSNEEYIQKQRRRAVEVVNGMLSGSIEYLEGAIELSLAHHGRLLCEVPLGEHARHGSWFGPRLFEVNDLSQLHDGVFGPIMHVMRYRAEELDRVIDDVNKLGFGLNPGRVYALAVDYRAGPTACAGREYLCEPQHDRRRGRRAAVRW